MPSYVDHLYLNQVQLISALLENRASAPGSGAAGQVYYNTADSSFRGYNGSIWARLDNVYNNASDILSTGTNGILNASLVNGNIVTVASGKLSSAAPGTLAIAGDVTGTLSSSTVARIRGTNVTAGASAVNQTLLYNGTNYVPTILNISMTGDVVVNSTAISSATPLAINVTGIRNNAIPALSTGALRWTGSAWTFDNASYLTTAVTSLNGTSGAITLQAGTGIGISGTSTIQISNNGVTSLVAGSNISVSEATGAVTVNVSATPSFTSVTTNQFTLNSQSLTYNATLSIPTDIVTKQHLDNYSIGLRDWKESVRVATTASLTVTAANSTLPTATLTSTTNGAISIDGVALNVGDRLLVKNQSTNLWQNGIYIVTTQGTASVPFVLTRASDFNSMGGSGNISAGVYVYVSEGSTNQRTGWVLSNADSALTTLGTSAIDFVQFQGASLYSAGAGLSLSGGQFSITDTSVVAGTYGVSTPGATQAIPVFTVNSRGQLTSASSYLTSTITHVGTIAQGTWQGTTIATGFGGTGLTTYTTGDMIFASATNTLSRRAIGTNGQVLRVASGLPSWGAVDISNASSVTGILSVSNGGTGLSTAPSNGQILIGNGTGYTLGTLIEGNGISIVPGAGSITISTQAKYYETTWNTTATPATAITTGPYAGSGFFQITFTHNLSTTNLVGTLVDNATGEEYIATLFSSGNLNVASPTFGSTTQATFRFSANGWSAINTNKTFTVRIKG